MIMVSPCTGLSDAYSAKSALSHLARDRFVQLCTAEKTTSNGVTYATTVQFVEALVPADAPGAVYYPIGMSLLCSLSIH